MQIAWEDSTPTATATTATAQQGDEAWRLIQQASARGLAPPAMRSLPLHNTDLPLYGNCYIKFEWMAHVCDCYKIIVRLAYVALAAADPHAYHRCLRSVYRPRNQRELSRWLGSVRADPAHPVEWRLEVEMASPCSQTTLVHGLYLHHLLRLLMQTNGPCVQVPVTRQQFMHLFRYHFTADFKNSTPMIRPDFARELLASLVRRHAMAVHPSTMYPMQPRPFDLTYHGPLCRAERRGARPGVTWGDSGTPWSPRR